MEIALLCAYAVVLVKVSRSTGKGANPSCAFFVNNRSSGAWAVAMSLVVSCVGASATMGMAGMAFDIGTPAFWWLGAGAVGITVLALLLAAKVRKTGSYTMPEMSEKYLGKNVRPLMSVIIVITWLAILAAQFAAMGMLLAALTGFPPLACLVIGFVLIVGHTLGGQAVVMRTDRIQCFLILAGLVILLVWLNGHNPGWLALTPIEAVNAKFTPADLVRYLFVVGGNYLVCPMLFGRFLSAQDEKTARRGGLLAGLGLGLSAVLIVSVGLACRGLLPAAMQPDAVLTTAIGTVLPSWLAMLVLLALISAVVSSADSCLVTAATVLSYDLLRSDKTKTGKIAVIVLGIAGAAVTFMDKSILGFLFIAYDIYVAGVVMPVFIALLLNKSEVARPKCTFAAVLLGGLFGAVAAISGTPEFSYVGLALSGILTLLGLVDIKKALPVEGRA